MMPVLFPLSRLQPHRGSRDHPGFPQLGQQHPFVKQQSLLQTPGSPNPSWDIRGEQIRRSSAGGTQEPRLEHFSRQVTALSSGDMMLA